MPKKKNNNKNDEIDEIDEKYLEYTAVELLIKDKIN